MPEDTNVVVSGIVIDTVKNKYLPYATVVIWGCNRSWFNGYCDSITSTKTTADGNFALSFKTNNGKYASYAVAVEPMSDDLYTKDYSNNAASGIKIGENNQIRLKARELNILMAKISILENPFDTILIHNYYSDFWIYNHRKIDTTFTFQILPMCLNSITYSIWDSKNLKQRTLKDTMTIYMADTTFYKRIINSSLEIPFE